MAVPKKITNFLDKNKVKYNLVNHKKVFTALDKAATLKTKPARVAKTLIVKLDKEIVLVAVPAHRNLDKNKFKKIASKWRKGRGEKAVKKISFGTEKWIKNNLKGAKIGAVPPLGSVWKLPTFVDNSLMKNPKILINSGDHKQSIEVTPNNFQKAVPGIVKGSFGKAK
jgi:Ala-tRNA(Pro) deacylase